MDTGSLLASQSKPNGKLQVKQEILLKNKQTSREQEKDIWHWHTRLHMYVHNMQTLKRDIESLL